MMDVEKAKKKLTEFWVSVDGVKSILLTTDNAEDIADLITRQQAVCDAAKYRQEIKHKVLDTDHEMDVLIREEAENTLIDALKRLEGES